MATRRVPLSANPNVVNSPVRNSSAALGAAIARQKYQNQKRAYASLQREEPYGQPPPSKKQIIDNGGERVSRSPSKQHAKLVTQRATTRVAKVEHPAPSKPSEEEIEKIRTWQNHQRERFPKYIFYFESVPDEHRSKLVKLLAQLGAREEKFFSINITHVITTRAIPPEKPARHQAAVSEATQRHHEEPQTINPSLLSRHAEVGVTTAKSKLFEHAASRRMPTPVQESVLRQATTARNTDVLVRAREMDKKIWSMSKLQRMLEVLFEPDPYHAHASHTRATEEANLAQLLNKERTSGPSDRDPTVTTKELVYFKGPYIYIYDIEEKQKPIMVREYVKVADKRKGDWPQFRTSSNGRCPFLEDEPAERKPPHVTKEHVEKPAVERAPKMKAPEIPPPKPVTGKRSLAEMEDGHNRRPIVRPAETFDLAKVVKKPANVEFTVPNVFTSRAKAGRFLAGEPVASGVQPSNITSAIRSQMISSATGVLGSKAGTSKEVHGLQRKVLQKSNPTPLNPTHRDMSSQRLADMRLETASYTRSASLGSAVCRKAEQIEEGPSHHHHSKELKRALSVPVPPPAPISKPKKRDLKPGYCENCQDKFADFDEHILSRKHRKFAEDEENWTQLDGLLQQLDRIPRVRSWTPVDEDVENW